METKFTTSKIVTNVITIKNNCGAYIHFSARSDSNNSTDNTGYYHIGQAKSILITSRSLKGVKDGDSIRPFIGTLEGKEVFGPEVIFREGYGMPPAVYSVTGNGDNFTVQLESGH
jgi:hypothetical protein